MLVDALQWCTSYCWLMIAASQGAHRLGFAECSSMILSMPSLEGLQQSALTHAAGYESPEISQQGA